MIDIESVLTKKIESLIDMKKEFDNLSFTEQVKYIAFFYVKSTGRNDFTAEDIKEIFDIAALPTPQNVSDLCNKLYSKEIFIKKDNSFSINRRVFKDLERELFQQPEESDIKILYVSGDSPWTDRNKRLADFIKKIKGEVIILEKHYGLGTFHVLENFQRDQKIKFLTSQIANSENVEKVEKELKRFKKEFPNVELKKYPKPYELHDRYMLSKDMLIWVGQGIKDFGDSECFLIGISREKVFEVAQALEKKFKERWVKSDNLS